MTWTLALRCPLPPLSPQELGRIFTLSIPKSAFPWREMHSWCCVTIATICTLNLHMVPDGDSVPIKRYSYFPSPSPSSLYFLSEFTYSGDFA